MDDEDRSVLAKAGATWKEHQEGQFSILHPHLEGSKFVWYPRKGTLMYEPRPYKAIKLGEGADVHDVVGEIKKKINEKLPEGW